MIQSMTAYASRSGALPGRGWSWELRGVNGRGLDLRLRLPEGIDGLEPAARAALAARLVRGNVSATLRMTRDEGEAALAVDPARLATALAALGTVAAAARAAGLDLAPVSASDILNLRGVLIPAPAEGQEGLMAALTADLGLALDDFVAMRRAEGRALAAIIAGQLDRIEALLAEAAAAAHARRDEARATLTAALRRVFEDVPEADQTRVAQELALIALRTDVAEEIDRLTAHVAAARGLIAGSEPAGRRLDFLAQEFNREANTLCSKAQSAALTRIGLDLKAVIDQMREQIQNVE